MKTIELTDAAPFLGDPDRLRALAVRDGYLYFRRLLPTDVVQPLRQTVLAFARETGWLDPQAREGEALAMLGKRIGYYQDPDWVQLQVRVQGRQEMWDLGDHVAIHRALHTVEVRSSFLHLSTANTCRVFSPHPDLATQPHQDAHYVRMLGEFWTAWIPLGECPRELGPLAVLAGSHREGLREHCGEGIVDGGVVVPEDTVWSTTDYQCGDVILFRPLTLHRALPNRCGQQLRLSADFRYGFWDETSAVDWRAATVRG